jgi:hypothetical protein
MTKLATAMAAQHTAIVTELAEATTASDLAASAEQAWLRVAGPDSAFAGRLHPRAFELLTIIANPALMAVGQLANIDIIQPIITVQADVVDAIPSDGVVRRGVPLAFAAGVAAFTPAGPVVSLGAGVLAGLAATAAERLTSPAPSPPTPTEPLMARLELDRVRARLPQVLEMMATNYDRLINLLEVEREEVQQSKLRRAVQIEEVPNVLAFLHAAMDAPDGLDRQDPFPAASAQPGCIAHRVLHANGIEAVMHCPGENDHLFDSRDVTGREVATGTTLKPALLRDGALLASGIVATRP